MLLLKGLVLITVGWFCYASAVLAQWESTYPLPVLGHKPVLKNIILPEVIESNSEVTIHFDSEDKDGDAISYDVTYKIRERDGRTVNEYHAQSADNKLTIKIPDGSYEKSILFEATPRNSPEKRPNIGRKVSTEYKPIKGVISSPFERGANGKRYGYNSTTTSYSFSQAERYCKMNSWRLATKTEVINLVVSKGYGKGLKESGFLNHSVEEWDGGGDNIEKGPYNFRFVVARDGLTINFIDVFQQSWHHHKEASGTTDYGNAYVCVH
ncbi:hypothetical protein ACET6F_20880 [Aeromonas veronii]